jgi:hypothetical protein
MKEYNITGHRYGDPDDNYVYEETIERNSLEEAKEYVNSLNEEFEYFVIEDETGDEWYSSENGD